MARSFQCPQGHQWEDPFGRAPSLSSAQAVFCPICGSAVEPRTEVVRSPPLLPPSHSVEPASVIVETQTENAPPLSPEDYRPEVAGYEILGVLGRGGMGVVYQARQLSLGRVVALKMIRGAAHAGWEDLARFRAEAEIVARLQHPHIVQVYEVGEQDGCPFFSLEYVEGGSLARWLAGSPQPAQRAARLLEVLARAVHHAHRRGIVHRDLKPANVLLAPCDPDHGILLGKGPEGPAYYQPKITDFGLAKRLDGDGRQTRTGEVMGTPSYMAPEQAGGVTRRIGPALDVYALGAILHEMLTGRPPFLGVTPVDTVLQVLSAEPVSPRRLQPKVPRDVDTICLKCLQKEPRQRYESAEELAEDLRRFLAGEPIRARPVPGWVRGVKWARRRPVAAALAAVSVLGAVLLVAVLLVSNRMIAGALEREKEARDQLIAAYQDERRNSYFTAIALAQREWEANNLSRVERILEGCPRDLRRWEWHYLKRLCHADLLTIRGISLTVGGVAFTTDGKRLVSVAADQAVKVWDAASGREIFTLPGKQSRVAGLACSPDGKNLAVVRGAEVRIWDLLTRRPQWTRRGLKPAVTCVAYRADGRRLVTGGADQTINIWDAATGRLVRSLGGLLNGHLLPLTSVAFSAEGRHVASASEDSTVKVWDAKTGRVIHTLAGHTGPVHCVAFSPRGLRLASASSDRTVKVWDAQTGKVVYTLARQGHPVLSVAFSPDGKRLITASRDQTVKIWDVKTRREVGTLEEHNGIVSAVAISGDGLRRVSACGSLIKVDWMQPGRTPLILRGHRGTIPGVAFSPDGRRLASAGADQTVKVWDAQSGGLLRTLNGHDGKVSCVAYSPRGTLLASAGGDATVRLWDAETGRPLLTLRGHTKMVNGLAFRADGRRLVTAAGDQTVSIWDSLTGERLLTLRGHTDVVADVAFSLDGTRLASASWDGTVKIWEATSGREVLTLRGHNGWVTRVAFSPDGRRLASGSADGTVRILDATPFAAPAVDWPGG